MQPACFPVHLACFLIQSFYLLSIFKSYHFVVQLPSAFILFHNTLYWQESKTNKPLFTRNGCCSCHIPKLFLGSLPCSISLIIQICWQIHPFKPILLFGALIWQQLCTDTTMAVVHSPFIYPQL